MQVLQKRSTGGRRKDETEARKADKRYDERVKIALGQSRRPRQPREEDIRQESRGEKAAESSWFHWPPYSVPYLGPFFVYWIFSLLTAHYCYTYWRRLDTRLETFPAAYRGAYKYNLTRGFRQIKEACWECLDFDN
ncbi:hypothetical protein MGYG_05216 [Nannizzia gypsea CBS 118893]|uniref:Uncharacterized protein n=1 Tax=Arthroderma gypseum (strain ATCC MYA-4604 / CBS 118893) TaxID=535722 RepID=E4UV86_ARTGP|nr:hypothetical protein MGYG_05216 [Nannizzia gypsea CBS 118893]EFR02213.1 hypothetical protein MGYG_05216 [Nannizzia gypsea CBS 118893]